MSPILKKCNNIRQTPEYYGLSCSKGDEKAWRFKILLLFLSRFNKQLNQPFHLLARDGLFLFLFYGTPENTDLALAFPKTTI